MKISFDTNTVTEADALEIVLLLGKRFNLLGAPAAATALASGTVPAPTDEEKARPANDPAEKLLQAAAAKKVQNSEAPAANPDYSLLDEIGMPWDERIHAATKTKMANGTWKLKRQIDPALVDACRAEVMDARNDGTAPAAPQQETTRQTAAAAEVKTAPTAPAAPKVPDVAYVMVATEMTEGAAIEDFYANGWTDEQLLEAGYFVRQPQAPAVPTAPKAPVAPQAPAAGAAATEESPSDKFTRIMNTITQAQKAGQITGDDVTDIYKAQGLTSIAQALTNPAALAAIDAALTAKLGA